MCVEILKTFGGMSRYNDSVLVEAEELLQQDVHVCSFDLHVVCYFMGIKVYLWVNTTYLLLYVYTSVLRFSDI